MQSSVITYMDKWMDYGTFYDLRLAVLILNVTQDFVNWNLGGLLETWLSHSLT